MKKIDIALSAMVAVIVGYGLTNFLAECQTAGGFLMGSCS